MNEIFIYGLVILSIFSFLATFCFYNYIYRNTILVISLLFLSIGVAGSLFTVIGKPVSVNIFTKYYYHELVKINVVWFDYKENEYILLLINHESLNMPLYVKIDWNKETAEKINEAMQKAKDNGGTVTMTGIFKDKIGSENGNAEGENNEGENKGAGNSLDFRKPQIEYNPPQSYFRIK